MEFHKQSQRKGVEDGDVIDEDEKSDEESWAVLIEKEYQAANKYVRGITPTKKPIGR